LCDLPRLLCNLNVTCIHKVPHAIVVFLFASTEYQLVKRNRVLMRKSAFIIIVGVAIVCFARQSNGQGTMSFAPLHLYINGAGAVLPRMSILPNDRAGVDAGLAFLSAFGLPWPGTTQVGGPPMIATSRYIPAEPRSSRVRHAQQPILDLPSVCYNAVNLHSPDIHQTCNVRILLARLGLSKLFPCV
jgi:hypothetical protein